MHSLIYLIMIYSSTSQAQNIIFESSKNNKKQDWQVVDDGVMGGLSKGTFEIDENGLGKFSGKVSTANNGGFSSVRHPLKQRKVSDYKKIRLKIKGDGKVYQCRIKHQSFDNHAYVFLFQTNGEWQTIDIPLAAMYPSFRGRKLEMPHFNHEFIEEIAFLIGNKTNESFSLLIEKISLEK